MGYLNKKEHVYAFILVLSVVRHHWLGDMVIQKSAVTTPKVLPREA